MAHIFSIPQLVNHVGRNDSPRSDDAQDEKYQRLSSKLLTTRDPCVHDLPTLIKSISDTSIFTLFLPTANFLNFAKSVYISPKIRSCILSMYCLPGIYDKIFVETKQIDIVREYFEVKTFLELRKESIIREFCNPTLWHPITFNDRYYGKLFLSKYFAEPCEILDMDTANCKCIIRCTTKINDQNFNLNKTYYESLSDVNIPTSFDKTRYVKGTIYNGISISGELTILTVKTSSIQTWTTTLTPSELNIFESARQIVSTIQIRPVFTMSQDSEDSEDLSTGSLSMSQIAVTEQGLDCDTKQLLDKYESILAECKDEETSCAETYKLIPNGEIVNTLTKINVYLNALKRWVVPTELPNDIDSLRRIEDETSNIIEISKAHVRVITLCIGLCNQEIKADPNNENNAQIKKLKTSYQKRLLSRKSKIKDAEKVLKVIEIHRNGSNQSIEIAQSAPVILPPSTPGTQKTEEDVVAFMFDQLNIIPPGSQAIPDEALDHFKLIAMDKINLNRNMDIVTTIITSLQARINASIETKDIIEEVLKNDPRALVQSNGNRIIHQLSNDLEKMHMDMQEAKEVLNNIKKRLSVHEFSDSVDAIELQSMKTYETCIQNIKEEIVLSKDDIARRDSIISKASNMTPQEVQNEIAFLSKFQKDVNFNCKLFANAIKDIDFVLNHSKKPDLIKSANEFKVSNKNKYSMYRHEKISCKSSYDALIKATMKREKTAQPQQSDNASPTRPVPLQTPISQRKTMPRKEVPVTQKSENDLEQRFTDLRAEVTTIGSNSHQGLAAANRSIKELQGKIDSFGKIISQFDGSLASSQELSKQLSEMKERIDQINSSKLMSYDDSQVDPFTNMEKMEQSIQQLSLSFNSVSNSVKQLEGKVNLIETIANNASTSIADAKSTIALQNRSIIDTSKKLESQSAENRQIFGHIYQTISDLSNRENVNQQMPQQQQQMKEKKAYLLEHDGELKLQTIIEKVENLTQELSDLKAENEELKKALGGITREEIDQKFTKVEEEEKQTQKSQQTIWQTVDSIRQSMLSQQEKEKAEHAAAAKKLAEENEKLRQERDEIKQQIQQLRQAPQILHDFDLATMRNGQIVVIQCILGANAQVMTTSGSSVTVPLTELTAAKSDNTVVDMKGQRVFPGDTVSVEGLEKHILVLHTHKSFIFGEFFKEGIVYLVCRHESDIEFIDKSS